MIKRRNQVMDTEARDHLGFSHYMGTVILSHSGVGNRREERKAGMVLRFFFLILTTINVVKWVVVISVFIVFLLAGK